MFPNLSAHRNSYYSTVRYSDIAANGSTIQSAFIIPFSSTYRTTNRVSNIATNWYSLLATYWIPNFSAH
jgi:hypothetical protein